MERSLKDLELASRWQPVFLQLVYMLSLLENTPKGTFMVAINAIDWDNGSNGEIVYSFSSHNSATVRALFDLDSRTGEIRVKEKVDYEASKVSELNIKAMDRGAYATPVYCRVLVHIVDMNDNAPEMTLTSLSSSVPEDATPGTMVPLIRTTDKDYGENGQIRCQIENNILFKLDSSLKDYYRLLTQELLDRESIGKYDITVLCSNNGKPSLASNKTIRVEVIDINDNAPRFTEPLYTSYVTENNGIGVSIFSVTAFDPDINKNGRLSYCILDSGVQGVSVFNYVRINSKNGIVYSQRYFDFEQLKIFQVYIQVQDSGLPPLTSSISLDIIVLDQNDNAPVILYPSPEFGSP